MALKGYEFLIEHEHYERTKEFSEHSIYVFYRPLGNNKKRMGTIQVPTVMNGNFGWYFSTDEVEPWFQELVDKAERKSLELFRIKRVIEGKM